MRRADRLFQIVQIIRSRKLTTASQLAEQLEISIRTVYRDVNDLICSGVPIRGEAGVGYTLDKGYDLPPLMFNFEELAALTLGARIVQSWGDPTLAASAKQALTKIEQVLPKHMKQRIDKMPLFAVNFTPSQKVSDYLAILRGAIHDKTKVEIDYTRGDGEHSNRTLRPLCLTFFAPIWMLTAWCELRGEFRSFRLDRMRQVQVTSSSFIDERGKTLDDFLAMVATESSPVSK